MLSANDFHVWRRHRIALGASTLIAISTMAFLTTEGQLINPPSPHQISQLALLAAAGAIIWTTCLTSWCYRNATTFTDRAASAAWRSTLTRKEDEFLEQWQAQRAKLEARQTINRVL